MLDLSRRQPHAQLQIAQRLIMPLGFRHAGERHYGQVLRFPYAALGD